MKYSAKTEFKIVHPVSQNSKTLKQNPHVTERIPCPMCDHRCLTAVHDFIAAFSKKQYNKSPQLAIGIHEIEIYGCQAIL